jgi:Fur family iron response transcriptional regulator
MKQDFSGDTKELARRLRAAGLRPTQQRITLAKILFADGDRHVTAEQLFASALGKGASLSLATVYNTLQQFGDAGLLRRIGLGGVRNWFDTNTEDHHHLVVEKTGEIVDLAPHNLEIIDLPPAPLGYEITYVDVVIRLRPIATESS